MTSLRYPLDPRTVAGDWRLEVSAERGNTSLRVPVLPAALRPPHPVQVEQRPCLVMVGEEESVNCSPSQVRLQLPPAVLGSGATLRGNVTASLAATGRAVCGNLTLTAEILDADRRVLYKQVQTVIYLLYVRICWQKS